jgi:hypothetical protein
VEPGRARLEYYNELLLRNRTEFGYLALVMAMRVTSMGTTGAGWALLPGEYQLAVGHQLHHKEGQGGRLPR